MFSVQKTVFTLTAPAILFFFQASSAFAQNPARIRDAQGVLDAFNRIIDLAASIMVALAVVYFIYNGFMFVSAGGDEKKATDARRQLIYSLIAIALIILSVSAFRVVGDLLGAPVNNNTNTNTDDFETTPR